MGERNIVALGGGSLSERDAALVDFVLALAPSRRPRVCFIGTATGDAEAPIVRFYEAFTRRNCAPRHLALFGAPDPRVVRSTLSNQDVIYVGGGNTANMLAVWRLHGVDQLLREAWEKGTVLAGMSAGANCWFEGSTTDSFGPIRPLDDGLALLPGTFCPHYDAEAERRATYLRLVADGFPPGFAAEDGVAIHFRGSHVAEVVSSRRENRAFRVELRGGDVHEAPLSTRWIAG